MDDQMLRRLGACLLRIAPGLASEYLALTQPGADEIAAEALEDLFDKYSTLVSEDVLQEAVAEVEEARIDAKEWEDQVDRLEQDLAKAEKRIEELEEQNEELEEQNSELEARLESAQNEHEAELEYGKRRVQKALEAFEEVFCVVCNKEMETNDLLVRLFLALEYEIGCL